MEWQDEGIVLTSRPHGESQAIVSAITLEHGRHAGLVHGGQGRRTSPLLQPGNRLQLTWKARLTDHLGQYAAEPMRLLASRLIGQELPLLALASACALLEHGLAEREPYPRLYAGLLRLLEGMVADEAWLETYIRFELLLLADLGFGLDLGSCVRTGAVDDLAYVSPRTGRAVSRTAAGEFAPRLLPLPAFLLGSEVADEIAACQGLRLTGYFLRKHVFEPTGSLFPAARERLADRLAARAEKPS